MKKRDYRRSNLILLLGASTLFLPAYISLHDLPETLMLEYLSPMLYFYFTPNCTGCVFQHTSLTPLLFYELGGGDWLFLPPLLAGVLSLSGCVLISSRLRRGESVGPRQGSILVSIGALVSVGWILAVIERMSHYMEGSSGIPGLFMWNGNQIIVTTFLAPVIVFLHLVQLWRKNLRAPTSRREEAGIGDPPLRANSRGVKHKLERESAGRRCPECSNALPAWAEFCDSCGAPQKKWAEYRAPRS